MTKLNKHYVENVCPECNSTDTQELVTGKQNPIYIERYCCACGCEWPIYLVKE